jgi:hypothetical protein
MLILYPLLVYVIIAKTLEGNMNMNMAIQENQLTSGASVMGPMPGIAATSSYVMAGTFSVDGRRGIWTSLPFPWEESEAQIQAKARGERRKPKKAKKPTTKKAKDLSKLRKAKREIIF